MDPAVTQLRSRALEARAHADALESQVEELRLQAEAAAQQARRGRARLLMEGTTPAAARTASQKADDRLASATEQARHARARARDLARQAEQEQHTQTVRAQRLLTLEPAAARQGITRRHLQALDETGLRDWSIEPVLSVTGPGRWPHGWKRQGSRGPLLEGSLRKGRRRLRSTNPGRGPGVAGEHPSGLGPGPWPRVCGPLAMPGRADGLKWPPPAPS
ncbi:hypothetical protein HUT17_05405 (plasmid) [Nocardiopsis flavescens]|nr:hypothetical protein HUT17_05405 [Nocardiopsis flavescens]